MKIARENIIASHGNLGLFAAATPVYGTDGKLNGVLANQLVIYNYDTGVSLSPGDDIADAEKIVVAQGIDLNGDGLADVLRGPFGDKIFGCNITKATVAPPVCGLVDVVDITANCISCNEEYAINITVEDDSTQNQYPYNRPAVYTFSVNAGCCACDSCDDGIDAQALFCKLADQINGKNVGSVTENGMFLNRARKRSVETAPFHAYSLFLNDYVFCMSPTSAVADTCSECKYVPAINQIVLNEGEVDEVTVDFTNTVVTVGAETLSLVAQLNRIVELINKAFADNGEVGSAVLTRALEGSGAPACCDLCLRINSCKTVDLYYDDGVTPVEIQPTIGPVSPFTALVTEGACKGCTTSTSTTPTAGLRIVSKPVDVFCNCFAAPSSPRGWFSRKIDVNIGQNSAFTCGAFHKLRIQEATIPEGFGYEWQTRAAGQAVGGMGRDYDNWGMDPHGRWGLPLDSNRGVQGPIGIFCAESYCVYTLQHNLPNVDVAIHSDDKSSTRGRTIVLIPSGDNVTQAEFEAIINPYLTSTSCPIKSALICSPD